MSEEFQKLHEVILGNRHQISPKVTGTTYEDDLKSLQMFFAAHDGGLKQKLAITCYFRIWKYFFCKRGRITKAKGCGPLPSLSCTSEKSLYWIFKQQINMSTLARMLGC